MVVVLGDAAAAVAVFECRLRRRAVMASAPARSPRAGGIGRGQKLIGDLGHRADDDDGL